MVSKTQKDRKKKIKKEENFLRLQQLIEKTRKPLRVRDIKLSETSDVGKYFLNSKII